MLFFAYVAHIKVSILHWYCFVTRLKLHVVALKRHAQITTLLFMCKNDLKEDIKNYTKKQTIKNRSFKKN